jgi:hypothetical protein
LSEEKKKGSGNMAIEKLTEAGMRKIGVGGADNILTGTPEANKRIFDNLPVEIGKKVNEVIDAVNNTDSALSGHSNRKDNPHNVTKGQVGLGNVDNTADKDKPVSDAVRAELETKADKTEVEEALKKKVDVNDVSAELEKKADSEDVANALSLKADKSEVEKKADKIDITTELEKKADKAELEDYVTTKELADALEGVESDVDLSNYLSKDNTEAYTPSADYNPATKKYVDDAVKGIEIPDGGSGVVNINIDQTYNPTSENPQSGKAVAEALRGVENTGGGQSVYDKVITTQAEFDELISSDTWLGCKVIGLACDVEITSPVVIPETVRTFEGAGGTRIISVPLTNENYTTACYLSTTGNVAVNNIDFNFNLDEELTVGVIRLYGVKGIQHIKNCRVILYENVKQKSFGFFYAFSECRNMFECNTYQGGEIKNPFVVSYGVCSWLYGCRVSGNNGSFSSCNDMYGCVAENGSTFNSCENVFGVRYMDVQIPMYMYNCKNISGITLRNTLAYNYEDEGILNGCSGVSNVQLNSAAKDSDGNYIKIEGIVNCSYVSNVRVLRTTFSGANTKVDVDSCDYVAEEA